MAEKILHLDFETRSCADLRKVGLDVYAVHPSTDVLCAAYAFDEGPVQLWIPGQPVPRVLVDHIVCDLEVWAHNAFFELAIVNEICAGKYNWPILSSDQMVCTMAMAYAMGLPGSLDGCAAALGITERKDAAGGRLMLQLSKPKTEEPLTWWDDAERLQKLYDYCRQDVVVERAAGNRMLRLSPYEKKVWKLDWEINKRGITADVPTIKLAIALVECEKDRLNTEMRKVTGNNVAACSAVQQIKDYLEFYGVTGDGLDKAMLAEHLTKVDLHPIARRVLELRAEAGKAATAKFTPMVTRAGPDNRVRGCFQYSGANTRRWAGRGIQLHNLKRPKKDTPVEQIIEDIAAGCTAAQLDMWYGSPMGLMGDCTRSFLMAAPGSELLVADFSAIEARVLAWLAGQNDVLEVFRSGQDIYKVAAASIFGVKIEDVTDDQRQVGKVAILALGYGGGVGAFQTMAKGYGVKMEPAFPHLLRHAKPDQRIRAEKTWASNKKNPKYEDISREEFLASDLTKIFWREANPRIVEYWDELEIAAISATKNSGQIFGNSRVRFKKVGSFLWCRLPGGGVICYPYPEVKEVKTPWGSTKTGLTYMAEDGQSKKWMRFTTYGGSIAENITQSVSRDLLADAMLRLDSKGFSIVAHVHDEIICEMPIGMAALQEMIRIMTDNPEWAKSLPIKASGFVARRYRK